MTPAPTPTTPSLQPRQLAGYLSGAVGMATVLAAPHTQAAVVYWNPADATATAANTGFRFDMLDGSVTPVAAYGQTTASGFTFWNGAAADYTFITSTTSTANPDHPAVVTGGSRMANLGVGASVDIASVFGSRDFLWTYFDNKGAEGADAHPWNTGLDGTTGFVGLQFRVAGQMHYGWARFTYDDATTGNLTLHDFAYENVAGTSINAGAIPEPGNALLALAGLGGVALRRRRQAA